MIAIMALLGQAVKIRYSSQDPEYYETMLIAKPDNYDGDPHTVSRYDDMEIHQNDPDINTQHKELKEKYGNQRSSSSSFAQVF